jgi:uroporphyrinogen-III synthase
VSRPKPDALDGVRVALLEARMGGELAQLVQRYGGITRSAPAVREATLDCAEVVADFLNRLHVPGRRIHVFLTGAGATAVLQEAERQGQLGFAVESLERDTIACRGPKPTAALKRYGLSTNVSAASPFTSHDLLEAMACLDLNGADVTVIHYGERSEALADALRQRGATLHELCVYEWRLPEDLGPLEELTRAIIRREVDAVIFTSQVQWKHLRQVSSAMGLDVALAQALTTDVVVAAVGPICSGALGQAGVKPHIVPDNPKMGPLVAALARHFSAPNPTNPTNPTNLS